MCTLPGNLNTCRSVYKILVNGLHRHLKTNYAECKRITGKGSFKTIVETLVRGLTQPEERPGAISTCVADFVDALQLLVEETGYQLEQITLDIMTKLEADHAIILKEKGSKKSDDPKQLERAMACITKMLDESENLLEKVLEPKPEPIEVEEEAAGESEEEEKMSMSLVLVDGMVQVSSECEGILTRRRPH